MVNKLDTFPKFIKHNYEKFGDTKVAIRHKVFGKWQSYTWKDFYENVKYMALGLIDLGLEPGDRVFIVGDNEPEWIFAGYAVQAAGCAFVGGYADSLPAQLKYFIEHSDAKFVIAEDQEQVDKVLLLKPELPNIKKAIYWDNKGMWGVSDPFLMSFDEVSDLGRKYEEAHPGSFEKKLEEGKGNDLALLAYTSGTTGLPKGAMLTHEGLIGMAKAFLQVDPMYETDELMSYIPLGWPGDFVCTIHRFLMEAAVLNFAEEPETVEADIREVGLTQVLLSPKLLEARMKDVETKILGTSPLNRFWYRLFVPIGYRIANFGFECQTVPLFWRILNKIAYFSLFRMIQDRLGYLKSRSIWTAGAIIAPEAYTFYHAIGVNLKTALGISEAGGVVTMHSDGDIQKDTVGPGFPGFQVRISDGQEVLLKCPGILSGYHKNPEAYTKAVKDGWLYTGDNGLVKEDGHLVIYDRMADLITLTDGSNCSPQLIESKLRTSPYIAEAIVVGESQPYLAVIITAEYNTVGKWAELNHIPYTTYADLSQKQEVYDLISPELKRVNRGMPGGQKIGKYTILHKQLDADDDELTRLRKLRRSYVEEHYGAEIEALYSGKSEIVAHSVITYQDERTRTIDIPIKIVAIEE